MAALACGRPRVPDGQTPGAGVSQDFTLLRLAGPAHNLIWGAASHLDRSSHPQNMNQWKIMSSHMSPGGGRSGPN